MQMNWTGERLEPFVFNEATVEHLHRYAIARDYVKDKTVLDIACGEGYGAVLLSQEAKFVSGVDGDNETILKAKVKYKAMNLEFRMGKAEDIPFKDAEFDVVTCFETFEHATEHQRIISEFKRVLKPGGLLILSTPDKKNYSDKTNYQNPYHLKELYEEQLRELISGNFKHHHILQQRLFLASVALSPEESKIRIYEGNYEKIQTGFDIEPLYHIAFASDSPFTQPDSSLFRSNFILQTAMEAQERSLKSTMSYQIGHNLLLPLKWIRKQFNHKRNS